MKWKTRTLEQVAELICGDNTEGHFRSLTGPNLTRFFRDADTEFIHDGSTRRFWVAAKAARNWIGNKLDQSKRSQILFMDREDIVNLFVVSPLIVPQVPRKPPFQFDDSIPF